MHRRQARPSGEPGRRRRRDYSFQFLMEEVAVAVQYRVPYVLVMLNNAYMGLIRQAELGYDMNFAVDLGYEGPANEYGIDNVGVMEAMGALGAG